jgi:hypothetical protein
MGIDELTRSASRGPTPSKDDLKFLIPAESRLMPEDVVQISQGESVPPSESVVVVCADLRSFSYL